MSAIFVFHLIAIALLGHVAQSSPLGVVIGKPAYQCKVMPVIKMDAIPIVTVFAKSSVTFFSLKVFIIELFKAVPSCPIMTIKSWGCCLPFRYEVRWSFTMLWA